MAPLKEPLKTTDNVFSELLCAQAKQPYCLTIFPPAETTLACLVSVAASTPPNNQQADWTKGALLQGSLLSLQGKQTINVRT